MLLVVSFAAALAQSAFALASSSTTNAAGGGELPSLATTVHGSTTTHGTDKCLIGMLLLCGGTYTQKCIACASAHAKQLQADSCTNERVTEICNNAEMAVVNITITPPVTSFDSTMSQHATPVQTFRASNAGQATPGYFAFKPLGPGGLLTIGVSADPIDRYYATTTMTSVHMKDGSVWTATFMLALRLQVSVGPISTITTLDWDNYMVFASDDSTNTNVTSLVDDIAPLRFKSAGTFAPNDTIFQTGTSYQSPAAVWGLQSGWVVRYAGGL